MRTKLGKRTEKQCNLLVQYLSTLCVMVRLFDIRGYHNHIRN